MRVVFAPEVEEDLYGLIKILVEKEYLGTYPFAISYVEELIADIQQNIHSKLKKKAPAFFERYGKDMYYITYQRNSNTEGKQTECSNIKRKKNEKYQKIKHHDFRRGSGQGTRSLDGGERYLP